MCIAAPVTVSATVPTAAYAPWEVMNSRYAMAYLDGDSLPERVEVAANAGNTQLNITFGDNRTVTIPVGLGETIALIKLYSADLTSDGNSELVALTYDPLRGSHTITIVETPFENLSVLRPPDPGEDSYRFTVGFARGYVLEISNKAYTFMQSVPLTQPETRKEFRADGTPPSTLIASVSPTFSDCTFASYNGRQAMELWQAITSNVQNQTLGYVVSMVVWEDGLPKLVGQRYASK